MNLRSLYSIALSVALLPTIMTSPTSAALMFDTVFFADDFEGFADGHVVSGAGNEAPSTGVGLIWQFIGSSASTVTTAESFGAGTKSLDVNRPSSSSIPRYFTYPDIIPEANLAANTNYGIQVDFNLTDPGTGLTGVSIGIAPGGGPVNAGTVLNFSDGVARVWNSGLGTYDPTAFSFGEGWQTLETTFSLGPDLGGNADADIKVFLTRHAGNSAGPLARTQIYQVTENLTLANNLRADINVNGDGRYYLDNLQIGTLIPEPGTIGLAVSAIGVLLMRRRSS